MEKKVLLQVYLCFMYNVQMSYIKKNPYVLWTVIFIILIPCVFFEFIIQNKAFYRTDGIVQHLTALSYLGNYFRDIIQTLFSTGKFIVPQWDHTLGLGADVFTTLHYYGLGDFLNLFAIFVPSEHTEKLYVALIFARLYLCGISFILYCRFHNYSLKASVLGSVSYVFCGFVFYCAVRHPFFINPMIYLPLMCLGIDVFFIKKKFFILVFSSFLACCSSFYFFYVLTILVVIYAFIRYFFVFENKSFSSFAILFSKTALLYVLAVGMASFVFLPNIAGFFDSSRTAFSIPIPFLYKPVYYVKLLLSIPAPVQSFSYTELGFSSIAFLSVLLIIFCNDNKSLQLKIFLIISCVLLIFPFLGHFFNGFNYVTNRWSFAVSFIAAMSLAYVADNFSVLKSKEIRLVSICSAFFSLMILTGCVFSHKMLTHYFASYLILFVSSVALYFSLKLKKEYLKFVALFLCSASVITNAYVKYSPHCLNYLHDFYDEKSADKMFQTAKKEGDVFKGRNDDFFRYEKESELCSNIPILADLKGCSYYWSQNSGHLAEGYNSLELVTGESLTLSGFNRRTYLQDLFGVKYEVINADAEFIPYDSKFLTSYEIDSLKYNVYEKKSLPFGFTYKNLLSKKAFDSLHALQKQVALLQTAVIDDERDSDVKYDFSKGISKLSFDVLNTDGIKYSAGVIKVLRPDSVMAIEYSCPRISENYFEFKDLYYISDLEDKVRLSFCDSLKFDENNSFEIKSRYNKNGHNFLICTGYTKKEKNILYIKFPEKGEYTFSELDLYTLDLSDRNVYLNDLSQDTLQNVRFDKNTVSGTIDCSQDEVLCMSTPYSKGWRCFVDDKPVCVNKVNLFFTGISLSQGKHKIVMQYNTPYLKQGIIISVISFFLFCVLIIVEKKRKFF